MEAYFKLWLSLGENGNPSLHGAVCQKMFCVYGGDGVKLNYCFSIFLLLMLNYGYILVFVTDYNTTIGCGNTVKMYLVAFHYIAHSR